MADYIGKKVLLKTEAGNLSGKLTSFNKDAGKLILEDSYNISNELDLLDILEVQLIDIQPYTSNDKNALDENTMHSLFYDAFNVYGPFEDNFCSIIATSLKKFLRDMNSAKIKIIIGSDDLFGRIGLCFARMLIGRVQSLDVEVKCDISDLRSCRYMQAFKNSGGSLLSLQVSSAPYTLLLFACNRDFDFDLQDCISNLILVLDIPQELPFLFTGLGLGFKPENYRACPKFYYLVDVGFSPILCDKYGIPKHFKSSLNRENVN